jgi:hypothetical protein
MVTDLIFIIRYFSLENLRGEWNFYNGNDTLDKIINLIGSREQSLQ